jgi:protein pelota
LDVGDQPGSNTVAPATCAGLVDSVRAGGGEALIFSSMHVSGESLNQLSGIAAILRFPLPELEDQEIADEI